jgi:dipeptidyl aminopeptidase/acylaminoacyl peptidase
MAAELNLTVFEETIEDALHAAALAKTMSGIDPERIYIAGHSLGGYLIPRISAADKDDLAAGFISMAGSVRSMTTLMLEQIDYILSITEGMSEPDKTAYKNQIAAGVAMVEGLKDSDRGGNQAVMGAFPTYWLDLAGYKPDEDVKSIKKSLLFLQGGHDYQVTAVDFEMWKAALRENPNARFILYPDLTHTFVKTENKSTPADYNNFATADEKVAADIKAFVTK